MTKQQEETAIDLVAEQMASRMPPQVCRQFAREIVTALGERFDLVERARETILEEVGK